MDEDVLGGTKRFKIPENLFVWLGNNKITMKDLQNPLEHFTMLFTESGILDFHQTQEGTDKKYKSLAQIDFPELFRENFNSEYAQNQFLEDIISQLKEVTFEEPEFSDCHIIVMDNIQDFQKLGRLEKRKFVMDEKSFSEDITKNLIIPWNKAKGRNFEKAAIMRNNETIGILFQIKNRTFLMSFETILNSVFGKKLSDAIKDIQNNTE